MRRGRGVARARRGAQAGAGGAAARPGGPHRGGGGALLPAAAGEEAPAAQHTGTQLQPMHHRVVVFLASS